MGDGDPEAAASDAPEELEPAIEEEDEYYILEELDEEELEPVEGFALPPPPPEEEGPQPIAGRFEVIDELGPRALGTLYHVLDLENQGRTASLVVLDGVWAEGAAPEALLAAAQELLEDSRHLTHNTINRLREVGLTGDGRVWLASDSMDGETVQQLADRTGTLPPRHAMEIIHQVLLGLAHGHEQQLVHGALDSNNITLTPRVAWTDENPFGVGVRLGSFGLASLDATPDATESELEERVRRDLMDVGLLMAELLTGTHFQRDGSDWVGTDASIMTAGLTVEARAALDRALSLDPVTRFSNAGKFLIAIEKTEEFRPRESRFSRASIAALILVFAASAALVGTRDRWAPYLNQSAQASSPSDTDQLDELAAPGLDSITESVQEAAAWEGERRELETTVAELNEVVASSTTALESTVHERDQLLSERERLGSTLDDTQEKVEELSEELLLAQQKLRQLEAAIPDPTIRARAVDEAAMRIDLLAQQLLAGELAGARSTSDLLAGDEVLEATLLPTGAFFSSLVEIYTILAGLDAPGDPFEARSLLADARTELARLKDGGELLLSGSTGWEVLDEGRRVVALRNLLKEARAQLETQALASDTAFQELWADALQDPDRSPAEIARLTDVLGSEGWPVFIRRYFDHVSERALGYDRIQLDALGEIETLPEWVAYLRDHPQQELKAEISLLSIADYAQRFYSGQELPPLPSELEQVEPNGSWRERLALATAILDPDRGLRGAVGKRLLYFARSSSGEESWRWDTILADPNPPQLANASRLVLQEFHDAEGVKRGERTVRVYRVGLKLFEEDARSTELLNLAADALPYEIRDWRQLSAPLPPERLLASRIAVRDFQRMLEHEAARVFVVDRGGERSLWTRELGLVQHSAPGRITYELVLAE